MSRVPWITDTSPCQPNDNESRADYDNDIASVGKSVGESTTSGNKLTKTTHNQSTFPSFSRIDPSGLRTLRKSMTRMKAIPVSGRLISITA